MIVEIPHPVTVKYQTLSGGSVPDGSEVVQPSLR